MSTTTYSCRAELFFGQDCEPTLFVAHAKKIKAFLELAQVDPVIEGLVGERRLEVTVSVDANCRGKAQEGALFQIETAISLAGGRVEGNNDCVSSAWEIQIPRPALVRSTSRAHERTLEILAV